MIFLCTSMYCEAQPFIKQLNLKKDSSLCKFQVFKNDKVVLVITGIGKIKAAIATTYLFSKYQPKNSDLFINIGVCGSKNNSIDIGNAFFCNKIIDNDTKNTFYPDVLFKHPFKEASVETFSSIINENNIKTCGELIDMESSAIYQSALIFFYTHEVFFIKIISDHLESQSLNKEKILRLVEDKAKEIIMWMNKVVSGFFYNKNILSSEEKKICVVIEKNLRLSTTMRNQFKRFIIYYKLQYDDLIGVLKAYKNVQCKSKNEGKRCFAELKGKLI